MGSHPGGGVVGSLTLLSELIAWSLANVSYLDAVCR